MKVLKTAMLFCIAYTSLSFHCLSQSGIITTVTVDDNNAFAGRQFVVNNWPSDIAVDSSGNLYIPDSRKHCVRKVTPDGKTTVVAGNGNSSYGRANLRNGIPSDGGESGKATEVSLMSPVLVAVDSSGSLYIVEGEWQNRIRKITNGIITTVVGNEGKGFGGNRGIFQASGEHTTIQSLAVDSAGNLYFVECDVPGGGGFPMGPVSHRLQKLSAGAITTIVAFKTGPFPQTAERSIIPSYIALDSADNLYVADAYNNGIYKYASTGLIPIVKGIKSPISGNPGEKPDLSKMNKPGDIAVDSAGNIYVADRDNNRICKVTPDGKITNIAGTGQKGFSGDSGPATAAQLSSPGAVALDSTGNLYIADSGNNRIRKVALSSPQSSKKPND
jgi:trimeric autotransporter adhesin